MPQTQLQKHLRAKTRIFWPISIIAVGMLLALVAAGLALVDEFDKAATDREQSVVENGIAQRVKEIAALPLPQVIWDDAVRHLDNKFDARWAEQNIGTYLDQTAHFHATYLLDQNDRPLFAYRDHEVIPPASYAGVAKKTAALVADVRRLESRVAGKTKLGAPIQSSGIIGNAGDNHGDIHIVTATLIGPDFGTARLKGARAPVLVTDMEVDQEFLTQFASRFLLDGVHVHPGDSRLEPHEAHVALRDRAGNYVATIDWLPQKPGTALLHKIGIPALLLIASLVLGVLYFVHRGIRSNVERITSQEQTQYLMFNDGLTGLPNRLRFVKQLDHAFEQLRESDQPIAVLSIDLDRFEEITKAFGHRAADEYIVEAARRMARYCRPSDVLARFSADEFGLFMTKAEPDTAARLASRLCEAVAAPMILSCGQIFAGCSIGISLVSPIEDISPSDAMRHADIAMHRAKRDARGHYCLFENEMDAVVKNRRALELDLRKALDQDALQLHYQPQVDRRGYVTGVEALVRWNHPERGAISPGLFVPIAEECGLIMQLGMFTLRRAFRDSKRWPELKIAINVSAIQIKNDKFLSDLAELVAEMNVDPRNFELEITEGILINDDPETQDRLRALRNMGFELALDDFGTGYSSLSYLSRYPVNKIKIDRSFISNLGRDSGADAVVNAIVKLARALKLAVIAEGVETTSQRGQLARAGCFAIQGHLYSRAVPAEDIDRIYSEDSRLIQAIHTKAA